MTILIIEDEPTIADLMEFNLMREGYSTRIAEDGITGLEQALQPDVDLVLLDVMLPGMDGFEVLKKLREKSSVPVIMVTAREEEQDKVMGLESGADDYITKPFSLRELMARVRANLRRTAPRVQAPAGGEVYGPFTVYPELEQIHRGDTPLELTQREYELALYFFHSPGRIITREELMQKVWGYDYYGDLRAVDVAMRRLREKLEGHEGNWTLKTVWGVGYKFEVK